MTASWCLAKGFVLTLLRSCSRRRGFLVSPGASTENSPAYLPYAQPNTPHPRPSNGPSAPHSDAWYFEQNGETAPRETRSDQILLASGQLTGTTLVWADTSRLAPVALVLIST